MRHICLKYSTYVSIREVVDSILIREGKAHQRLLSIFETVRLDLNCLQVGLRISALNLHLLVNKLAIFEEFADESARFYFE